MGQYMKKFLVAALISASLLASCSNDDNNVVQGYIAGDLIYEASSQSGILTRLDVQRGQAVKEGQTLFELDPAPQSYALTQANDELESAKATLQDMELGQRPDEIEEIENDIASTKAAIQYYQAEMSRYKQLSQQNYASKSSYDEKLYLYEQNTALLKKLEASLRLAKTGNRDNQIEAQKQTVLAATENVAIMQWNKAQKTVATSTAGLVFDTYYRRGEWIPAGQAVASIQTPENIYVVFFVSEAQLGKVQVGDTVAFQCDSCKSPTPATINYISSEAEYTPPVIYSESMREKLVYEVHAIMKKEVALQYHPGQPVDVALNGKLQ